MTANLQLAAQILDARFHNAPNKIGRHITPACQYDADHEALAAAIALIIAHLDSSVDQLELPQYPPRETRLADVMNRKEDL